jgi:hypothetical protein
MPIASYTYEYEVTFQTEIVCNKLFRTKRESQA